MTPRWLAPGVVVIVTLAAFFATLGNGLASARLRWMFTSVHAGHYIPLTWLRILAPVAAAWLPALVFLTWYQTSLWRDSISLWSQAALVPPGMPARRYSR